jgi:hypothetical protein
VRLRQRESAEQFGAGHRGQVLTLLRFSPELVDDQLRKPMHGEHAAQMTFEPREFLEHDCVARIIQAAAAVFGRERNGRDPKLAELTK